MGRRRRISLELLEPRQLLHAAGVIDQAFLEERATIRGEVNSLGSETDQRISLLSAANKSVPESAFIGPRRPTAVEDQSHQQWKVWLRPTVSPHPEPILRLDALLDSEFVNFNVIGEFGSPSEQPAENVWLVESFSAADDLAASSLASKDWVTDFQSIDPSAAEMESVFTNAFVGPSDALQLLSSDEVFNVTTGQDSVDANVGDGICADASGACSLRAAIQEANASAPSERTIMLDVAEVLLDLPHQPDSNSEFPDSEAILSLIHI